jgi:hypothetical protein
LNKGKLTKLSLLLVPLFLIIPAASASTTTTGSGSGTFTATVAVQTTVFTHGGVTLYYLAGPDVLTGIETGTATFTLDLLVFPSGHDVGAGSFTCTPCTFNGQTGTFTVRFTSEGTYGGSGTGQGILTGSGSLTGLTGHATFSFSTTSTGFTGPYAVSYQFAS